MTPERIKELRSIIWDVHIDDCLIPNQAEGAIHECLDEIERLQDIEQRVVYCTGGRLDLCSVTGHSDDDFDGSPFSNRDLKAGRLEAFQKAMKE